MNKLLMGMNVARAIQVQRPTENGIRYYVLVLTDVDDYGVVETEVRVNLNEHQLRQIRNAAVL